VRAVTRAAKGGLAQTQPAAKPVAADAEAAIKKKTRRGRRNRKPASELSLAPQEHQGTQPARQQSASPVANQQPAFDLAHWPRPRPTERIPDPAAFPIRIRGCAREHRGRGRGRMQDPQPATQQPARSMPELMPTYMFSQVMNLLG